jgi:hypothetical protein
MLKLNEMKETHVANQKILGKIQNESLKNNKTHNTNNM